MRTVILVPRRDDGGPRDRLWAWCKARWSSDHPDLPIFEGYHRDGLFNRSAAVNEAARLAGEFDVAVIIDADVIIDPDKVREGIAHAASTGRMVLPYQIRRNLTDEGTEFVMSGTPGSWERFVRRKYRNLVSSVVIVPRSLWDEIGGFDEGFRGWGAEDDAFAACAQTFAGIDRLAGDVWHLSHPGAIEGRKTSPNYIANAARAKRYLRAAGKPDAIRAIQAEVRTIGAFPDLPITGIPRILHRVVPEVTKPEAEAWWGAFEVMHPGWTLMTHRDPLDPKEWPLTAAHWSETANGAQFADLIRLEALLRWGGIYVDQDVEPFRSLEPLLALSAFAAWEDERCVPNAVMGASPGHPAIRACLDTMLTRLPGPTWPAGPGVLTDVLPGRGDVLLLPPGSFYAVHYRDPERRAKMTDPSIARRNPWAFVLHHYWGSWLEEEPRRNVRVSVTAARLERRIARQERYSA